MRTIKNVLMLLMLFGISMLQTGCWNYREIDKLDIVAGVAVDKGVKNKYKLTIETLHICGGRNSTATSKIISVEGKTMFDAARNAISITGKRLYWSHAKVIIISKQVASDGVLQVLDWYNRDSETRSSVFILISKGECAKEIFDAQKTTDGIISFELEDMLRNQRSLGKAPTIEIADFINDMAAKGLVSTAPTIELKHVEGKIVSTISGTAIFKKDKLIGYLNADETKTLLFLKNQVKAGILVEEEKENDKESGISLEIFKNKTKVTPIVNNGAISFNVDIDTNTAIDEIEGTTDVINDSKRKKLEKDASQNLEERAESLIKKVQFQYDVDIFGFGAKLYQDKPKVWEGFADNWEDQFKYISVNVKANVYIRNSAMMSKPLKIGD